MTARDDAHEKAMEVARAAEEDARCDEWDLHRHRSIFCTGCRKARREAACRAYAAALSREPQAPTEPELEQLRAEKHGAYRERGQLVALLARLFPSGVRRTVIDGWDPEWETCVYIDLPNGQASWHFHDRDTDLLVGLPAYDKPWDGHTTEEKYARIAAYRPPSGEPDTPSEEAVEAAVKADDYRAGYERTRWMLAAAYRVDHRVDQTPTPPRDVPPPTKDEICAACGEPHHKHFRRDPAVPCARFVRSAPEKRTGSHEESPSGPRVHQPDTPNSEGCEAPSATCHGAGNITPEQVREIARGTMLARVERLERALVEVATALERHATNPLNGSIDGLFWLDLGPEIEEIRAELRAGQSVPEPKNGG